MKARKVKGLDPGGTLEDNARRLIAGRTREVLDLAAVAQDPAAVETLHDLRIAAKRLRYLLELTGPSCLGPSSQSVVKDLKGLQDVLGEIHDCDVQLPGLRALARTAPEEQARGLRSLAIHFATRRAELFERFHAGWPELERAFTPLSHATGDGRVETRA
jgi:CHAD domain-containing protein